MMLEVHALRAFYGAYEVLHGLDFGLEEGGITALLGANGAGKTTTLRALSGMVRTSGEIRFDGRPIAGRATEEIVRLGIAHVPEGRGTFVRMTVGENLQLGAMTRRDRAAVARALVLRPRLMLLDEPSFGLAPLVVAELFEILRRLNRELGVAMLIVEQNAALALDLADTVYLLETGRIVLSGPAPEIARDEGVRRAYLGY